MSNLELTHSELRTLLNIFEKCNFIYNIGHGFELFQTKRNFSLFNEIKTEGNFISYSSKDYSITFNKFEIEMLAPNFKITTLEDLIYMLFLFTMEFKCLIHPKIYIKNNEMWYKKECRSYKDNSILFMCEFTQHNNEINLINI